MNVPVLVGGAPRTKNACSPLAVGTTPGSTSAMRVGSPDVPGTSRVSSRLTVISPTSRWGAMTCTKAGGGSSARAIPGTKVAAIAAIALALAFDQLTDALIIDLRAPVPPRAGRSRQLDPEPCRELRHCVVHALPGVGQGHQPHRLVIAHREQRRGHLERRPVGQRLRSPHGAGG